MKCKPFNRAFAALLSAMLIVSFLPITVFAVEGTPLTSAGGELTDSSYYLDQDVTLTDNLTVPANATVTLDLNGFTLQGNGTGSVITVEGTLFINDSSTSGAGEITGGNAEYGGGIYIGEYGKVEMNGGKISNNQASQYGGGVYLEMRNASFTLKNGEISENTAVKGAGVYLDRYVSFTMEGGSVSNNTSSHSGGGVFASVSSKFNMSGGEISLNESTNNGGGVCVEGGYFTMSESAQVSNNVSKRQGGGVYVGSNGHFTVNSGKITDNTADGQGGGVYSNRGDFELKDVSITDNKTDTFGGGIYVYSAKVKISGKVIIYNNSNVTDGTPDNLYAGGEANNCVFTGNLTGNSKIGYKTTKFYQPTDEKTIQISATETDTEYYKTAAQYFSSDEGHGIRANDNGYLELYRTHTHTHTHSWSSAWGSDNTHHWHECTAESCPVTDNSQKDGYAAHTYDQKVVSDNYKASDATCTEPARYYYSCICGAKGTETFDDGDATGHSYEEPVWNWSEDGKTCTVTFTCANDETHKESPKVTVTSKIKTPATCTENGVTTYTATVEFNGETYTAKKDVADIPAIGHSYEDGKCTVCGAADPNYKPTESDNGNSDSSATGETTSPETGDNSNVMLWIAVMLAAGTALTGTVLYSRKRKYSR